MRAILIALLLLALPAQAQTPLSKEEWAREAAYLVLLTADYSLTMDLKNHPGMYEKNPILGRHPSDQQLRGYFAVAAIGHVLGMHFLSRENRAFAQWASIGIELYAVHNNYQLGLSFRF